MTKIGIIGAMDIEVEQLKKDMQVSAVLKKAGMEFYEGMLCGVDVVIARCGIGKVNAAICTQIMADAFSVSAVINTGVAGSLDARINIGDIVISTDLVQHDMDVRQLGYPLGQIPMIDTFSFPADQKMASLAEAACRDANPDIEVYHGRIVSGDQFISDGEVKKHLTEQFSPLCTEMEGASIAQTAYLNQLPFVVIRAISDKADDSAQMDYPTFEKKAAEHSIRLMEEFLRKVSESGI